MDNLNFRRDYYLKIKKDKYLQRNYQFRREQNDRLLVLNQHLNCYELLNISAALVYLMCNGKNSLEMICLTIKENFKNASESIIINDMIKLVNILKNQMLCENVMSSSGVGLDHTIMVKAQNALQTFFRSARQQDYVTPNILVIDC